MSETWREIAHRQDGVLARRQALTGGMTPRQWDWKLANGRWKRLLPGVVVTHSGSPTPRQRAWAACVYGGDEAVLGGDAALVQLGLPLREVTAFDVVIPARQRHEARALDTGEPVRFHRTDLQSSQKTARADLEVVTAEVATVQAAAWAPDARRAEQRIAAAVQARITTPSRVRAELARMPRLRRRALMLEVLQDVELGAHSGTELAYLRFCRAHGLPCPDALQVKVRTSGVRYLDARYVTQRITVELDGQHHRSVEHWEADALRTLEVAVALPGERVIRLTMSMMRHDEVRVAGLLARLLA